MGWGYVCGGGLFGVPEHRLASSLHVLDAPHPLQTKGKAAIDVICNPLGKSGGALIQQFMIIGFGSLAASTPYLGLILLGIVAMWIYAAKVGGWAGGVDFWAAGEVPLLPSLLMLLCFALHSFRTWTGASLQPRRRWPVLPSRRMLMTAPLPPPPRPSPPQHRSARV